MGEHPTKSFWGILSQKPSLPGLWESKRDDTAQIICGSNGRKKVAILIKEGEDRIDEERALIPIEPSDLISEAALDEYEAVVLSVFRIKETVFHGLEVEAKCQLISVWSVDTEGTLTLNQEYTPEWFEEKEGRLTDSEPTATMAAALLAAASLACNEGAGEGIYAKEFPDALRDKLLRGRRDT